MWINSVAPVPMMCTLGDTRFVGNAGGGPLFFGFADPADFRDRLDADGKRFEDRARGHPKRRADRQAPLLHRRAGKGRKSDHVDGGWLSGRVTVRQREIIGRDPFSGRHSNATRRRGDHGDRAEKTGFGG